VWPPAKRARHGAVTSSFVVAVIGSACAALGVAGCERARPPLRESPHVAAPAAADRGELCLDLRTIRACWGGPCGEHGCVVPRPVPTGLAPPSGFRCAGRGAARFCAARSDDAGEFRCTAEECVQQHARAPDNGEWECVDGAGAVYCRKVEDAAGVAPGPLDPAFVCGRRQGRADGQRVCVDFAPDLPPAPGDHACFSSYRGGARAWHCKTSRALRLGGPCSRAAACPKGAGCVSGFCLPPYPRSQCWLDSDCTAGAHCRFGSCAEDG
jgi:hypothetical protein